MSIAYAAPFHRLRTISMPPVMHSPTMTALIITMRTRPPWRARAPTPSWRSTSASRGRRSRALARVNDSTPNGSAVLLVNTGTPVAPRSGAVRSFLRRFLSDPRVIELPRALWLPTLYGLVLPLRSPRSAHRYRLIWQAGGSPLLVNSAQLRSELERELAATRPTLRVEQVFLYSAPDVGSTLDSL